MRFDTASPDTLPALTQSFEYLKLHPIDGSYYEFGLYQGYTLWFAQQAAIKAQVDYPVHFYGFDSFAGLPPLVPPDTDWRFDQADYKCSFKQVLANLLEHGILSDLITLIPGFYEDVLGLEIKAFYWMEPAAIVLIDCDLYHSTVHVLKFMASLLQEGTILLFDDWNCFDRNENRGERLAFREFLMEHPKWTAEEWITFGWHGQAFIMHKSS